MHAGVETSTARGESAGRVREGRRPRRAAVACAVMASCVAALVLFTSGCSLEAGGDAPPPAAGQAGTVEAVRAQFERAAEALRRGDRAEFAAALPAADGRLRERLGAIHDALSPLPWAAFGFSVAPLPGRDGVYRVVGSGQLEGAGPADRLAVVRYFRLTSQSDGVTVSADVTPEDLRRRYLMALHDPVVLQRPGLVVLADGWARARAHTVADAAVRARQHLRVLGLDTGPGVVVTIYGSAEDVRDALAVRLPTARLRFFAHPPLRVAGEAWSVDDVGVMGPWLRDSGESIDGVLRHELAHAYSIRWFAGDEHAPALLVEGIAAAAEGVPLSRGLRDEVASGSQLWPLPESFSVEDVWDDGDAEAVGLGYEVGRSLVEYVDEDWGASRLEAFVRAVVAAEATEEGLDAALEGALGVDWDEFYAGWRRYVLRGG